MAPTVAHEQAAANILGVSRVHWYQTGLAGLRLTLGFVFLWAFLDKVFGLGFSTPASRSWLNGGNPTQGFLSSSEGPLAGAFQAMAGHPATNLLFMGGLLAIGVALLLGIGLRIAGYSGAAMMLLMYASHLPPTTNPIVDDHIVYAIVLLLLPTFRAGEYAGLGHTWKASKLVQRFPILA